MELIFGFALPLTLSILIFLFGKPPHAFFALVFGLTLVLVTCENAAYAPSDSGEARCVVLNGDEYCKGTENEVAIRK